MLSLISQSNGDSSIYPLKHEATRVGRRPDACQLVLQQGTISGVHALIEVNPDQNSASILDLHSTNGTYVNGKKIASPTKLELGDIVRFGNEQDFKFDVSSMANDENRPANVLQKQSTERVVASRDKKLQINDQPVLPSSQSPTFDKEAMKARIDDETFRRTQEEIALLKRELVLLSTAKTASSATPLELERRLHRLEEKQKNLLQDRKDASIDKALKHSDAELRRHLAGARDNARRPRTSSSGIFRKSLMSSMDFDDFEMYDLLDKQLQQEQHRWAHDPPYPDTFEPQTQSFMQTSTQSQNALSDAQRVSIDHFRQSLGQNIRHLNLMLSGSVPFDPQLLESSTTSLPHFQQQQHLVHNQKERDLLPTSPISPLNEKPQQQDEEEEELPKLFEVPSAPQHEESITPSEVETTNHTRVDEPLSLTYEDRRILRQVFSKWRAAVRLNQTEKHTASRQRLRKREKLLKRFDQWRQYTADRRRLKQVYVLLYRALIKNIHQRLAFAMTRWIKVALTLRQESAYQAQQTLMHQQRQELKQQQKQQMNKVIFARQAASKQDTFYSWKALVHKKKHQLQQQKKQRETRVVQVTLKAWKQRTQDSRLAKTIVWRKIVQLARQRMLRALTHWRFQSQTNASAESQQRSMAQMLERQTSLQNYTQELQTQIFQLQHELQQVTTQLNQIEDPDNLQSKLQDQQQVIKMLQMQLEAASDGTNGLLQLGMCKTKITVLDSKNTSLQSQMKQLESDCDRTAAQLQSFQYHSEQEQKLAMVELDKKQQEIDKLYDQLAVYAALESPNPALEDKRHAAAQFLVDQIKHYQQVHRQGITRLEKEIVDLREQAQESSHLQQLSQQQKQQINDLQQRLEEAESQQAVDPTELFKFIDILQRDNQSSQAESDQLRQKIQHLQHQLVDREQRLGF